MNACIYAILQHKKKCDICDKLYKNTIELPININETKYDTNKLQLCHKCLQTIIYNEHFTILFDKLHLTNIPMMNKNKMTGRDTKDD